MNERNRFRIYEHMTQTRWLHVEDALDIGKLRAHAEYHLLGRAALDVLGNVFGHDHAARAHHDGAFDRVLKFADVAGPVV